MLGSRLQIIVAISLQLKVIPEIEFSGFLFNVKGSLLEFCIMEDCLAKKELNSSAFFLKPVTLMKQGRDTRNFIV